MNDLLVVVDMQNGFVNDTNRHIITNVIATIEQFIQTKKPIIFTRFINHKNSPYETIIKWTRLMDSPDIDIIEELKEYKHFKVDKNFYTPFTTEFDTYLTQHQITRMFVCGIATESCVMKTAVDAFERNITPFVIQDACYSHAGEQAHQAGLEVLRRNIGKNQLITLSSLSNLLDR